MNYMNLAYFGICINPSAHLSLSSTYRFLVGAQLSLLCTGTPPLMRFLGLEKNALKVNRVIGKPRYRRSILVLKPQIGEYESLNPCFLEFFTYFIFHTILDIISLAKTNLFEQRFESYNPYHMAN